jgi:Flp pilus assembly secretin CpaC
MKIQEKIMPKTNYAVRWLAAVTAIVLVGSAGLVSGQDEDTTKPKRLYINVAESEKIVFDKPMEDVTASITNGGAATNPAVVRLSQPNEKTLLLEALRVGKTTVTVILQGGEIRRFFISTFSNRGADILNIQNEFAEKGYRGLTVEFSGDQAVLTGTVETKEQLDDAERIVKKYTPYIKVGAIIGQIEVSTVSPEERDIVNQIQRIADIPGLIVKVKFPRPTEVRTTNRSRQVGQPLIAATTTDLQTRTSQTTIQAAPTAGTNDEGNELEQITITKNLSVPEKIFLFGELQDDLHKAKAIRVARTFCPFVVSFVTVKDPIQLRIDLRLLAVNLSKVKDLGIRWSNIAGNNGPGVSGAAAYGIGAGFVDPNLGALGSPYTRSRADAGGSIVRTIASTLTERLTFGFGTDARATIRFLEQNNASTRIQEGVISLVNSQPGTFSVAQQVPFAETVAVQDGGTVTVQPGFVSIGFNLLILPLSFERGSQTAGERLNLASSNGNTIIPTLSDYMQLSRPIGNQGDAPLIDEAQKYVDENGLIGMWVQNEVSDLVSFVAIGGGALVPQTNSRFTSTRAQIKEGQSMVLSSLFDRATLKNVQKIPFLGNTPLFGWLFKNERNYSEAGGAPVPGDTNSELYLVLTPNIVRTESTPDSSRMRKPRLPEMQNLLTTEGYVPQIKPVRFDMASVDLRPESDSKVMAPRVEVEASAPVAPAPEPVPAPPVVEVQEAPPAPEAQAPMPTAPVEMTPADPVGAPSSEPVTIP